MKVTRINMNEHTATLKVSRDELADIKFSLYTQAEEYEKQGYPRLADDCWKLWNGLSKAFEKLYSDVEELDFNPEDYLEKIG